MLTDNKKKFEHRIKTIVGQLRVVLKKAEKNPADAYGQLHTIERSLQQAKMFIIKDLGDQMAQTPSSAESKAATVHLYDCLGFHRDELPPKGRP